MLIFLFFIFKEYQEVNQIIGISFSLVYILYGLIWFYGKLSHPNEKSIMDDPKFWVSCGFLFWGVFFILRIIPRYLFNEVDHGTLIISQSFFFVINIFFYISFFVSLLKYSKNHDE
jgi:drug/metabolite transporter (DMT)-like permease